MQKRHFSVSNKLGLHARAAMKLSNLATRYQAKIRILHNERHLDVKDIMLLMALGATHGNVLEFHFDGPDEHEAVVAVEELFLSRFGED